MRIAVRAPDAASVKAAQAQLSAAGFEASVALSARRATDILVSACDGEPQADVLLHLAMATLASPPPQTELDGALALDAPAPLLRHQIEAWERIAIARDERRRRAATGTAMGLTLPAPGPQQPLRALYVGAANPAFLPIERALNDVSGGVSAAFSAFSGFDHLHDLNFDAVILNGADEPQNALSFCSALRKNSALFDLPTMVLARADDSAMIAAALERGACAILDESKPLEPPIAWLLETIRRERLRRAVEHDLRALRDSMGEPRTGLWRAEAFARHLDLMASQHQAHARPMSLAALRILPAHGASAPAANLWRTTCSEVASLAGRLAREADCVTALAQDQMLVALPMGSIEDARRCAERIAAVVECTSFAAGEAYTCPLVVEQSVAALAPGESGAALISRTLRAFALAA